MGQYLNMIEGMWGLWIGGCEFKWEFLMFRIEVPDLVFWLTKDMNLIKTCDAYEGYDFSL